MDTNIDQSDHTLEARYILTARELGKLFGLSDKEILPSFHSQDLISLSGRSIGIRSSGVRDFLVKSGVNYSFKILAHINLRGGIGKTTSTISLATRAAQYGFKTCILDLDSQGSASLALNAVPNDDEPIFYDIWQKAGEYLIDSLKKIQDNLFILPSSLENGLLDIALANPVSQKNAVKDVCDVLKENGFNLVVIDCPPSLGAAVISSICAATDIVVPVGSDPFSFKGLKFTLRETHAICETYGKELPRLRILYSRYDRREKVSISAWEKLKVEYPKLLIPSPIRTSSEFTKKLCRQESIFSFRGKNGAKEDYDLYTREILGLNRLSEPLLQSTMPFKRNFDETEISIQSTQEKKQMESIGADGSEE